MPPKKRTTTSSDGSNAADQKKSNIGRGRKNEVSSKLNTTNDTISLSTTKAEEESLDRNLDEHPLRLKDFIVLKYRDDSYRVAQLIEKSLQEGNNGQVYHYYIHYLDFNRRMDEWILPERILTYPSIANKYGRKILKIQKKAHELLQKHKDISSNKKKDSSINLIDMNEEEAGSDSDVDLPEELENNSLSYTNISDFDHDEHEGLDENSLIEHENLTKVKNIQHVQLGKYIMECWYFSPFPLEYYSKGYTKCIYFCEYSMRFFKTKEELIRFQKVKLGNYRSPPGIEIYRDDQLSMFEIDGALEKFYCQNLAYFAKLFLDHKTLYWDVDPFLFYVLCTRDEKGFHPVGYFSKEK